MSKCNNIYFIGMMGAGKTTVGRFLARRLKKRFVDCDREIEERTGVRVPVIFEIEGEQGFRRREAHVLQQLSTEQGIVLATGGGVVLNPENRATLAGTGLVIYLWVPPEELYERTRHDKNRPLLQVSDPQGRIRDLHAQRDPLYRDIADIVVDGSGQTALGMARQLEKEIRNRCAI